MWFGDLVTMRWWNGIWLNEAFATFMSMLAVDDFRPDWEIWNTFTRDRTNAFEIDALETTRPIEYEVRSPDDARADVRHPHVREGRAVLRMLEQWLGADRFRDGIRRYLARTPTGTPRRTTCGTPSRRRPASRSGGRWTPGSSSRATARSLRRSRRRPRPVHAAPLPPVQPGRRHDVAGAADGATGEPASEERLDRILIEADGAELGLLATDAVVVANAGSASFVRVFYDDELRSRVVGSAMEVLSPIERYGLVDDAWAAVVAGQAPAGSFLDLAGVRRTRPISACGRRSSVVWLAGPVRRRRAARAPAGVRAGPRAAGARAARLGPRGGRDRPRAPAASSCSRSRSSEPTRRRWPSAASSSSATRATPSSSRPPWKPWPRRARGGPRSLLGALPAASTPQQEERYLFATSRFPGDAEIDGSSPRA